MDQPKLRVPTFTDLLRGVLAHADRVEPTNPLAAKLIRSGIANYNAEMRRINGR
jgi:hypothetical protein